MGSSKRIRGITMYDLPDENYLMVVFVEEDRPEAIRLQIDQLQREVQVLENNLLHIKQKTGVSDPKSPESSVEFKNDASSDDTKICDNVAPDGE